MHHLYGLAVGIGTRNAGKPDSRVRRLLLRLLSGGSIAPERPQAFNPANQAATPKL